MHLPWTPSPGSSQLPGWGGCTTGLLLLEARGASSAHVCTHVRACGFPSVRRCVGGSARAALPPATGWWTRCCSSCSSGASCCPAGGGGGRLPRWGGGHRTAELPRRWGAERKGGIRPKFFISGRKLVPVGDTGGQKMSLNPNFPVLSLSLWKSTLTNM